MHKNIIHITGNDSYGVELELQRWLGVFDDKFGDINIERYDLSDTSSLNGIGDILLMSGLFASSRLFIFRGGRDRKSKSKGLEKILTEKIEDIPENHFLLFYNIGEKEEGLLVWLKKNADIRQINTIWDIQAWGMRSDIEPNTLTLVFNTYKKAENSRDREDTNPLLGHHIAHTLEMIALMEASGQKMEKSDIISLCHGYSGGTVFSLTDAIIGVNIPLSIEILQKISSINKVDGWFGIFMGTLRNHLYIKYLRHHNCSESEVANLLKKDLYTIKKGYTSRISYSLLRRLYEKLVTINVAYKRGKGLKDNELGRILGIELALLDLQK